MKAKTIIDDELDKLPKAKKIMGFNEIQSKSSVRQSQNRPVGKSTKK